MARPRGRHPRAPDSGRSTSGVDHLHQDRASQNPRPSRIPKGRFALAGAQQAPLWLGLSLDGWSVEPALGARSYRAPDTVTAMSDVSGNSPFDRDEIAALYDAVPFAADIPFYLDLVAGARRVLELGCGTGRLLLPLAEAGSQVVGVDASDAMLARARRRLAHAPRELRERVELREGDMRGLELAGRFDAVVVATKTFFYLMTPSDQRRMLSAVARLLDAGGIVALDLLNPTLGWLSRPAGSVRQDVAGEVGEARVLRTETVVSTHLAEQRRVMRSVYDVVEKDGTVRKHVVEWGLRYTYRFELEYLLEICGLEVLAVTGGYRGEPFEADSPIMLVTARR